MTRPSGEGLEGIAEIETPTDREREPVQPASENASAGAVRARRGEARTARWIVMLGVWFVMLLGVRAWVLEPVRVDSDSMEPGLKPGQLVLADKFSLRFDGPSPGDVVLAREPGSGQLVVKRVVAVGGDTVGIEDGSLIRNGLIVSENYTNQRDMAGFFFGPDPVPEGHVFLLGDNRFTSSDSRAYGPVPVSHLEGRVLFQP